MQIAGYHDSVFINCPFDDDYMPILRAITFTVYRCGFLPRTALEEDNASHYRLNKIIGIIKDCRYGIHDLSRIELNSQGYPRFNMPFELGIFFGAKYLGGQTHQSKNALIFERRKFSYQKYISDINGMDTKAHQNTVGRAIEKVRDWLKTSSRRKNIPGYQLIHKEYKSFRRSLPDIANNLGFSLENLPYTDYLEIIEETLAYQLQEGR
jgi:hypothetical protein